MFRVDCTVIAAYSEASASTLLCDSVSEAVEAKAERRNHPNIVNVFIHEKIYNAPPPPSKYFLLIHKPLESFYKQTFKMLVKKSMQYFHCNILEL